MPMESTVRRRCVFYFAGFDPSGPAHYHRLYKEQAALQATLSDYSIEVGTRTKKSDHLAAWTVTTTPHHGLNSCSTHTDYFFARWDDIVRTHWRQLDSMVAAWHFLCAFLATQWHYLRTGAQLRMLRLAWPPVVALVSPLALVLTIVAVWLITPWAAWIALPDTLASSLIQGTYPRIIGTIALWAIATLGLAWLVRNLEYKFHMLWLMRSYLFTRQQALGQLPVLEKRLQSLADDICVARNSGDYDEVLIVGHSSGCILAASALARSCALVTNSQTETHSRLGLITLGQWLPLLSSLPSAHQFRSQLQALSHQTTLSWVDISAPADGCCFALVDAVAAGVPAHLRGPCVPKLFSPRFQTLFTPVDYKALCKHRFDLHFQYIMAGRIAGEYDFFALTAGALTLKDRYAYSVSITNFTQFKLF
jgi:hypothetical protein